MPLEDPPDWLDISKDMIRRKLCCKKESKFPESYIPDDHPLAVSLQEQQELAEKEG